MAKRLEEQLMVISAKKNVSSVELDGSIFMEFTPQDDIWKKEIFL